MISLYDYQQDLYDRSKQALANGKRRVLVVSPCGSGKSYLFGYMCEQAINRGRTVLVLVHRKELAEQHRELFRSMDIPTENIRIALFQTEINRLGKYKTPDLIIADEAHNIPNTLRKVLDFYNTFTIGLTATPCRLTGEPMGTVYDEMITGISVKELIGKNRLAPYIYYSVNVADISQLHTRCGDYVTSESETLLMQSAIYGDVIKSYKKFADGKKTIIYCASIKHSQAVAEAFRKAGYAAVHFDSNTPKAERQQIMRDFRDGKIKIICNVLLIVEGISVNDCECCILLRPTLSTTIFIQSAMRCMRYTPGKVAVIIDCVANYTKLGFPDDNREWTLDKPIKPKREYDDEGRLNIRQCSVCFRCFKTADKCPYCGTEYKTTPRELKEIQGVELKRIEEEQKVQKKKDRMQVGMCRTFSQLLEIQHERGYKNGWAYVVAKKKGIL